MWWGGGGVALAEGYESIVHKKREYDIPKGVVYLAGGNFSRANYLELIQHWSGG
jgi:hypothetical protein